MVLNSLTEKADGESAKVVVTGAFTVSTTLTGVEFAESEMTKVAEPAVIKAALNTEPEMEPVATVGFVEVT